MKNFLAKLAGLILLTAAAYLGWRAYRLRGEVGVLRDTVRLLELEKRELQQQSAPATRVWQRDERTLLLRQLEKQTSQLRGLPFRRPVTYKDISRDELREFLKKKLAEQYSAAELHDYSRTLETLGAIPAGTDVMEVVLGLYDEQVAAFYVPEERALYTFKDMSFAGNIDKTMLAHELTHALQDQNYDLTKFPLKIKDNDDLALASAGLIEGDATLLMAQFYGEHLDVKNMLGEVLGSVMGQRTAKFQSAPPYFRDTMLFPYQEGLQFAMALFSAGGVAALNAAFEHPPVSTKEVLHPEIFLHNRQAPERIALPKVEKKDWRLIGDNVLGEFGLRTLLAQYVGVFEAQRAAAGWNGDRFHVYEQSTNGACVVVWQTAWDNETEAAEFVTTYRQVVQKRGVHADIERAGARVSIVQATDEPTRAIWRPSQGD